MLRLLVHVCSLTKHCLQDLASEQRVHVLRMAAKWLSAHLELPARPTRKSQTWADGLLFELEEAGVEGREACLQCACEAVSQLAPSSLAPLSFRAMHS